MRGLPAAAVASIALADELGRACSMVVRHHAGSDRWSLDLPYGIRGELDPDVLRAFATDVLAAVERRPRDGHPWREVDHLLFVDPGTETQVTVGATEAGPYLLVVAYLTPEPAGTAANGDPLFFHPLGAAYVQWRAEPADARALADAGRAVLDRLGPAPAPPHCAG